MSSGVKSLDAKPRASWETFAEDIPGATREADLEALCPDLGDLDDIFKKLA